jgi:hypothetical protein
LVPPDEASVDATGDTASTAAATGNDNAVVKAAIDNPDNLNFMNFSFKNMHFVK